MKLSNLHEAPTTARWPNFLKKAAVVGAALTMLPQPQPAQLAASQPSKPTPIVRVDDRKVGELEPSQPRISVNDAMAFIEPHEGRRNKVYSDSRGIPTIGIGFNLLRRDAPERLQKMGRDYDRIRSGQEQLTDQEINELFKTDIGSAHWNANAFVDFAGQPKEVQLILTDMAFNLGANGLNKFRELQKALNEKDYQRAAQEMINSRWYGQVGNRSKKLVKMMASLSK